MLNSSHLNPNIIKALWRQQQELLKKSPEYVTPIINQEDPVDIQCDLEGPKATPYECGIFRVKLIISNEFPTQAPKGIFITKIFHPNISVKGEICVNTLKKDWNPSQWNLCNLFEVIKCLLIVPFPQSALNEEAGKLFMENYDEYFKIAKMYTNIYAMKNNCNSNVTNNNNDDDIEMEDKCEKDNNYMRNNVSIYSQSEMKVNRNMVDNDINLDIIRRRSEIPRSNYNLNNLNYNCNINNNLCDNETKKIYNNIFIYSNNCANNNININNINVNSNNIFSNYPNINNQCFSSKEKPNLSFLPLMQANQIKNNNNIFGYHRSFTDNNISYNNRNGNGYNNSQEINKWIMRI
jgi:ubiquitin-conjugating enzyme E2 S